MISVVGLNWFAQFHVNWFLKFTEFTIPVSEPALYLSLFLPHSLSLFLFPLLLLLCIFCLPLCGEAQHVSVESLSLTLSVCAGAPPGACTERHATQRQGPWQTAENMEDANRGWMEMREVMEKREQETNKDSKTGGCYRDS